MPPSGWQRVGEPLCVPLAEEKGKAKKDKQEARAFFLPLKLLTNSLEDMSDALDTSPAPVPRQPLRANAGYLML